MKSQSTFASATLRSPLLNTLKNYIGARSLVTAILFTSALIFLSSFSAHAQTPKTYYVDCTAGVDTNPGTSTTQAWKSITKANNAPLQPGDTLLFKRGCAWQGPLKATWIGTAAQPIVIGAYGSGNLPRIQDSYSSNVQITGKYLIVEYIETLLTVPPNPNATCSNQPVAWKLGFSFGNTASYNTVQHSKASKLAIGVFLDYKSHHNKVLNNQLVDNNVVWELDATQALGAMGVLLHGDYNEIAYNYFANNKTICTFNGIVESNSIELHGARYSNIRHNTSYNDRVFSELGSSATYPSTDNTFAYNLHVVGPQQSSVGSRFIVTRGQGHAFGPVWRTKVFNNTIYHTGVDSKGITCQLCSSETLSVKNNILWVDREPISVEGTFIEEYNVFWSTSGNPLVNFAKSLTSKIVNPNFVNHTGNDFRLKTTSQALNAGTGESVSAGFTSDLDKIAVPQSTLVDIGAYELVGTTPPTQTPVPSPTASPTPLPTTVPPTGSPTPLPTASPTASPTAVPPTATPSPTPVAPIAPCSITINDGALYTGDRAIQLKTNVPNATQMLVSTDAGFAGATWQPYQTQFAWTLPDTGARIATLIVYVRFSDAANALLCGSQTGDDIIYDPVPPSVSVAFSSVSSAANTPSTDGTVGEASFDIAISASDQDNGSGVERMQVSLDDSFSDPTWQPYSPTVTVNAEPGQTIYIRVQDGTGNISPAAALTIPGTLPESPDQSPAVFIPLISR